MTYIQYIYKISMAVPEPRFSLSFSPKIIYFQFVHKFPKVMP